MTQDALIPTDATIALTQTGRARRRPARAPHPMVDHHSKHPRGVRAIWCRACQTPVLYGLDDDRCAFAVRVDVTPLTAMGEALTLLAGRATYTLTRIHQSSRITRRTASDIKRRPAQGCTSPLMAWDVLAEHRCGQPIAATLTAPSAVVIPMTTTVPTDPPF